jgi:GTP-binding protein
MEANALPLRNNRQGKVYYAAQVGTYPPTVALVTNSPDLFDDTYVRYLTKTIRDSGPFGEVQVKLVLRTRGESGGGLGVDESAGAADDLPVAADTIVREEKMPAASSPEDEVNQAPPALTPTARKKDPDRGSSSKHDRKPKRGKKKPGPGVWEV